VYNENEDTHCVFEALGEPYQFTSSSDDYDPKSLPRSWKNIFVCRLNNVKMGDVRDVVDAVPVRNDLTH
jgi:hypothetical protein